MKLTEQDVVEFEVGILGEGVGVVREKGENFDSFWRRVSGALIIREMIRYDLVYKLSMGG
jgi:hypothetical protein